MRILCPVCDAPSAPCRACAWSRIDPAKAASRYLVVIGRPACTGNLMAHDHPEPDKHMMQLVLDLVRPYRGWLVIVFAAMIVEIAMSLAAPWPLKLVLDDALNNHKLPQWLAWAHHHGIERNTLGVAVFAGLSTLLIAVIAAIAVLHRQLLHHQHRPVGGQ